MVEIQTLLAAGMGALFTLAGLPVVITGVRKARKAIHVWRTPRKPVTDLEPGETAAVEGTVESPVDEAGTVDAPIARREGVAVETEVRRVRRHGNDVNRDWYHENVQSVPFVVADETGEVIVDLPSKDDFSGPPQFRTAIDLGGETVAVSADRPAPRAVDEYADAVDPERNLVDAGEELHFRQGVLVPGDQVYVLGDVVEDAQTAGGDLVLSGAGDADGFEIAREGPTTGGSLRKLAGGIALTLFGLWASAIGVGLAYLGLAG